MSILDVITQLAEGFGTTLWIFFLTLLFSIPLGLLVCVGRMSKVRPLRWFMSFYISVLRGTPLMLQLITVYFAPLFIRNFLATLGIISNISNISRGTAVIVAFSLNYAAYFAEIYRGGIQSISVGQHEAAQVLGYSKSQTFFKIIMPQVIKNIIPAMTNEFITLVKDTSLSFTIAFAEMFTTARQISMAQGTATALFVAGAFYYFFNILVAFVMDKAEKKLGYYR